MTIYRSLVTVLEPADSYDLVTLEQVKAYFNIPIVTDDPNDVRLQTLITLQSKLIADYCDRVFAHEKVSEIIYTNETLSGLGRIAVQLNRWPVTRVESLDKLDKDLTSLVEGTDFRLDGESGNLIGSLVADEITAVYEAGYNLPQAAPGPLSMAVIDMVRQSYFFGSRDPMIQSVMDNVAGAIRFFPPPGISARGGGGGGGGGGGQSAGSPLSPTATALVKPYRRPGMA